MIVQHFVDLLFDDCDDEVDIPPLLYCPPKDSKSDSY